LLASLKTIYLGLTTGDTEGPGWLVLTWNATS